LLAGIKGNALQFLVDVLGLKRVIIFIHLYITLKKCQVKRISGKIEKDSVSQYFPLKSFLKKFS